MADVYKRKESQHWMARWYTPDGKRVARSTRTEKKREAQKIADRFEVEDNSQPDRSVTQKSYLSILQVASREAENGDLTLARAREHLEKMVRIGNPEYAPTSLTGIWADWKHAQRPHISDSTAAGYGDDSRLFESAFKLGIMSKPITDLKPEHIEQAMNRAKAAGRRGATINKALTSLRRVLEWAVARGLLHANPAKMVRALPQTDSEEVGPFSFEEIAAMIEGAPDDEWKGFILIGAQTGLRAGDIASLTRGHISGDYLTIRPAKTARTKKVISVPLTENIKAWIGDKQEGFFPNISKLATSNRSNVFSRIMKDVGVSREVVSPGGILVKRSLHSLRHTFNSLLAEADVAQDVRKRLTGHESSKMNQRYTHMDEALRSAIGKLPSIQG